MSAQSLSQPNTPARSEPLRGYGQFLTRYLLPLWPRALLMAALLMAGIALQLASPQVIRYFLDTAQAGAPARTLLTAALIYIGFALGQQALSLAAGYASQVVGWAATNRLRADLALHCLRLDLAFHKHRTPGEMIERIDGDMNELAAFFSTMVVQVIGSGLLALGILALLFRENALVGLGLTAYTALTLFALSRIQRVAVKSWTDARQAAAEQYGYLEERISGAEEIRAMGAEEHALARLYALMRSFLVRSRRGYVIAGLTTSLTNLLYALGYAIGLGLGVYLYLRGEATIGAAYLITYYVGMLAEPLQGLRREAQNFQRAAASISRIDELLRERPSAPAAAAQAAAPRLPDGALSVEFDNLRFAYDDAGGEAVLEDITFRLAAGRTLGILGRTGSGKTTLTRLLFRLVEPAGGAVRLGGADLRSLPLEDLRARVGLVTQDVQLFAASLRDNLTFFDPSVPDERLEEILRALGLDGWLASLPRGLDTPIGTGGQGLSAGEAQLLAFARVFLKNPGLVVLDEASSRLDPATENRMERAIDRLFTGRTGIIIAHRLKTVLRADDILILEGGRVVEHGPREALAADPSSRFAALLRAGLEEALA